MCLQSKEFDKLILKLSNLKEIFESESENKLKRSMISCAIWLDNTKLSNEDCLYDLVCWNYQYYIDSRLIMDNKKYSCKKNILKNDSIDFNTVEYIKDNFMSLINEAIKIEKHLTIIDNLSDYYKTCEITISPSSKEHYLVSSLPNLIATFTFDNRIDMTEQLHLVHLHTFKYM